MNESFDPYYTWLAIPREQQPPHAYQLLGLPLWEANPEVIANASDARMTYVRSFQTSPHAAASQRLLNELSAARLTLLNAEKKADYDRSLRERLASAAPHVASVAASPAVPAAAALTPASPSLHASSSPARGNNALWLALGGGGLIATVVVAMTLKIVLATGGLDSLDADAAGPPNADSRPIASAAAPSTPVSLTTTVAVGTPASERTSRDDDARLPATPAVTPTIPIAQPNPAPRGQPTRPPDAPPGRIPGGSPAGPPGGSPFIPPNIPGDEPPRIASPFPAHWTKNPRAWLYERDGRKLAFVPTHAGWRELSSEGLLSSSAGNSTGDYVELTRDEPPLRIRLFEDRCDVSVRGGDFFKVHQGSWSKDPYPFSRALRFTGRGVVQFPEIQNLFRKGKPFLVEMWWRPIADQPVGPATLLSCGRTRLSWDVQRDGSHRFVVQTEGRPALFLSFAKLDSDWSILHFGSDGQRLFLADRTRGMAHLLEELLVDEAHPAPLTIGGGVGAAAAAGGPPNGLWIDVAHVRVSSQCRLRVDGPATEKSLSLRPVVSLPDTWQPDEETRALLNVGAMTDGRLEDRSGKRQRVVADAVLPIDVISAIPFFRPVAQVARNTPTSPPTPATPATTPSLPKPEMKPGGKPEGKSDGKPERRDLSDLLEPKPAGGAADPATLARLKPPSSEELAKTLEQVKELFKADYEKTKSASDKGALATKLGEHARKMFDDPVAQYVLWDEARRWAADAGQLDETFQWIDELSGQFEVESLEMKVVAARRVHELLSGSNNAPLALRLQLIEATLASSSLALESERYEEADQLAELAVAQSKTRQVTDLEVRRRAKEHAERVGAAKTLWQDAMAAETTLATTPDDPTANLTSGRYRCFRCNQWQVGLPRLAKSSSAKLAAAAAADLQAGEDAKLRMAAAAAWEKAASDADSLEKRDCLERAYHVYSTAIDGGLKGLDREQARQRLDAIRPLIPLAHPTFIQPQPDGSTVVVHPGLIGRVFVSGRDTGALVTYLPGSPISPTVMQQLLADVKGRGAVQIELSGYFLPLQRAVRVSQRGGAKGSFQRIVVDAKAINTVDPKKLRADFVMAFSPQRHTLVWQLAGYDSATTSQLELRDSLEDRPLIPFYTKQMLDSLRNSPSKKGEFRKEYRLDAN